MADTATVADETVPLSPKVPAFPVKVLIMIVVAALVAGLGGAFLVVKWVGGKSQPSAGTEAHPADTDAKADGSPKAALTAAPGAMFDIEPFIVNLADTPDIRYLKLTVKLEAENESVLAELAARMPQVRDTILILLSSKDSLTIRTAQGKFQLRDEITQRVNGLLPKPGVRSAYFTDFVVQ